MLLRSEKQDKNQLRMTKNQAIRHYCVTGLVEQHETPGYGGRASGANQAMGIELSINRIGMFPFTG